MKKIISAIIIICIIIIGFIAYKSMAKPTVKANAATLMNNSNSSNVQNSNTSAGDNSASGTSTANNTGNNSSANTNTTTNTQSQSSNASSSSNAESGQNSESTNQEATNSNTSHNTSSNSNSNNSINNTSSTSTQNSATNESNTSNGNITVTNADIQKGLYSNYIFEKSRKISINSKELAQNIFNNLNSNLKAKYNYKYNGLTPEEDNIILNGSSAQKQKLLDSIGNRLIINVTYYQLPSTTNIALYPTNYTNETYYYSFMINSLKNICENSNNWGKHIGLSTSSGAIMSYQTANNLITNQEIYTITNGTPGYPAYPNEYNFTNESSL